MDTTTIRNLYDSGNEHDACGVGMIVDIHGDKSHELVDSALKILENMCHPFFPKSASTVIPGSAL